MTLVFEQLDVVQGTFHHRFSVRLAVLAQHPLFQRAYIYAYADRCLRLSRDACHFLDLPHVVDGARVDAHTINALFHGGQGNRVIEVDVTYDGELGLSFQEGDVLTDLLLREGDAHQLAANFL